MDTALGLGAAILVGETNKPSLSLKSISEPFGLVTLELEILEGHGTILWNWDGIFGISNRRISLSVKWVMWDLVVSDVVEGVFQRPVSDWIHVTSAAFFLGGLEDVDPGSLVSLPASSTSDHDLAVEIVETSDEWLNLAYLIVFIDVKLPEIGSVLLVVLLLGLVSITGNAFSHGDVSLEFVFSLDFIDEIECFFEEMERVHKQYWNLFEKSESGYKMCHDNITSDKSIWEYYLCTRVDSLLDCIHCLLLKMNQPLVLTLSLKPVHGFLIPWSCCGSHNSWSSSHANVSSKPAGLLLQRAE